jgi:hypothetical protein
MADCLVLIGTLLVHPCARPAKATCAKCARPMCKTHDRDGTCVVCTGELVPAKAVPDLTIDDMMLVDPRDASAFDDKGANPASFDS